MGGAAAGIEFKLSESVNEGIIMKFDECALPAIAIMAVTKIKGKLICWWRLLDVYKGMRIDVYKGMRRTEESAVCVGGES